MATFFDLVLDTTGPAGVAASIDSGAAYAVTRDVMLAVTTTDPDTTGYQIKIWGDVTPAADENIQTTEGASTWMTLTGSIPILLSSGDGVKTLTARLRDDVWNESATASDSITLDTAAPVATVTPTTTARISKIAGKRTDARSFSTDTDVVAWKIKVVPTTGSIHSAGTAIATTNGSTNMTGGALAAATPQAFSIDGRDLEVASAGDGDKIVKVFVQDAAGNWSV